MHSADGKSANGSMRWLMIFGAAIAVLMLSVSAGLTIDAHDQAWQRAERSGANLTLALERDIKRTIASYDLSLQGAIAAFALPDIWTVSPELRQAALFDHAASSEDFGSILIADAAGAIVADSASVMPRKANLADRAYFQVQRASDAGLHLSLPIIGQLDKSGPGIALSRRLRSADGSFEGIVVGTMKTTVFDRPFADLDLGAGGTVLLADIDGHVISRYPALPDDASTDAGSETLRAMIQAPSGHFIQTGPQDGIRRLYAFRRVGDLPVILALGISADAINATWMTRAMIDGSIQAILCAATIALCFLFRREMGQRIQAAVALRGAMDRLVTLATLDGLTGVGNRRFFETIFATEWRRAQRGSTTMAVLMIDADWFKPYNDRYGHQAGDLVLQSIASTIQQSVRRPADFVARYGGEEFVVILPETDAAGANIIGETIRSAVFSLGVAHEGSPFGYASVSVGVAIADGHTVCSKESILKNADEALYAAKESGRNCVVIEDGGQGHGALSRLRMSVL